MIKKMDSSNDKNKLKDIEILLPDGEIGYLTKGTKIENIQVIAGKGRDRKIDIIDILMDKFKGDPLEWQKKKGFGYIDYGGESFKVELHWYEEPSIGKVYCKIKTDEGGNWFYEN